jgi:NADH-quinone oxidoreductase subunit E
MALSDERRAALEADAGQIIGRYPRSRSALLPLLHLVQAEEGYVSADGIAFCAGQLGLTEAEVTAVVSFYTMYKRRPVGDYHVGVCTNALCAVMGGDAIFADLQRHLGVGNDETTADGKVTLEHLECNAACDYAPVMMVNWEFFDDMTPQSARELVDGLQAPTSRRPGVRRGCAPGGRRPASWPAFPTTRRRRAIPPATRPWPACGSRRSMAGSRQQRAPRPPPGRALPKRALLR